MSASFWEWLCDNAKPPGGTRDLLAIAAVPGALIAFWIAVAQYEDNVNIARANTLIENEEMTSVPFFEPRMARSGLEEISNGL